MAKFIIIFLNVFLMANCCLAVFNANDYKKYGFIKEDNIRIERSIWGYRLRYISQKANSYAYLMAKLPQVKDSRPEPNKITFRFKARLYPVAPNTQDMRHVIKAYVKSSLGKTKEHARKNGVISTPAFVVSARDDLNKKSGHRSFPIQYSKRSIEELDPKHKPGGVTLLFRDSRLLPLNLFRNYDVEVSFDYPNKIVSFNSNGNKTIFKSQSMTIWGYYGLATLFSTLGYNKHTVIAFEYEFTEIKTSTNISPVNRNDTQKEIPRFSCAYYQELIEQKKDVDAMYSLGMNYYEGSGGAEKDYYQAFKCFKKSAMDEHVFGQYYLGLCYLYGLGTEKNNLLAWKWLNRSSKYFYDKAQVVAAQCVIDNVKVTNELKKDILLQSLLGPAFFQGNANAYFLQSYCAHYDIAKKGVTYLRGFKAAARRGHPKAYYYLGMYFAKKKRTLKTAFRCYFEAAERAFVPALVKLGLCYQTGNGTKKDIEKAFECFKKAAYKNNPEGIFRLACCYLLGQGVEENRGKAVELFKQAVKRSSPRALIALLLLQENDSQSSFFSGNDKAASKKSKNKKNSSYSSRRAISLKYGIGTVKSAKKALKYLLKSSKYNHWMAFELADSCENNKNKSRNFYKAINLYKRAAAKRDARASLCLAKLYHKLGNKLESILYYRQAVKYGNAQAAFDLAEILLKEANSADVKAQAKAFSLFEKAAKNGHVRACYALGDCYYKGQGIKKDIKRAAEWWKKYEAAFMMRQNNSIHGIYWKDLPCQIPIKYDKNGLPLKYQSHLKDKKEILNYYNKY